LLDLIYRCSIYACKKNSGLCYLLKIGFDYCQYVQKDNAKSAARKESKDKSSFIVVPRREDLSAESSMKGISEIEACNSSFLTFDF